MGSLTLIVTLSVELSFPRGQCKVPTDIEKISIKEAMHMGFYYKHVRKGGPWWRDHQRIDNDQFSPGEVLELYFLEITLTIEWDAFHWRMNASVGLNEALNYNDDNGTKHEIYISSIL